MATQEDIYEEDDSQINNNLSYLSYLQNQHSTDIQAVTQTNSISYDTELFIMEIENYPCLWNTSTRSHHDQNMRFNSWEELSKKFNKPG